MEKDENTNDTQVETQEGETETVEETATEESTDESQSDNSEVTPESELAHAKAEAAKYRRLFEKANDKPKTATSKAPQSASSSVDVDERILQANGMPKELLKELKVISKLRGVSLLDAQNDSIFVALKNDFDKDKKQKAASMGTSRGSGSPEAKKTFVTPNLSREEHMALAKGSL